MMKLLPARALRGVGRLGQWLGLVPPPAPKPHSPLLEEGWVIANHKLVSFHAAFLSSLFMLTEAGWGTGAFAAH